MDYADEYSAFRNASEKNRRLLLQEELILDVTEAIAEQMESQNLLQKDLAKRLNKTKGYVSQLLGGGRNLTLRTISDVADALDCRVKFLVRKRHHGRSKIVQFPGFEAQEWEHEPGFGDVQLRGLENVEPDGVAAGG